jgi:undecaprenyl-diphosphatase
MWDIGIFEALNYDGGAFWDEFWWTVTGKLTWAPLYLFIIWLLVRHLGWRRGLLAVVFIVAAVGAADLIAGYFKSGEFAWARFRPSHTEGLDVHLVHNYHGGLYGTVSAHAATTAAVATVSAWLLRRRWFTAMMTLWVLLVSYSRIYVAAHFPQDILLGLALGVALGAVMMVVWRCVAARAKY